MRKSREIQLEVCTEPAENGEELQREIGEIWMRSLRRQLEESGVSAEKQAAMLEQLVAELEKRSDPPFEAGHG